MNFITRSGSPIDWRSSRNDDLSITWGGINGSSSPCPIDWRLPTQSDWQNLITQEGITNTSTAFNSSLKLTLAGYRNVGGPMNYSGENGMYWSSTPI